MIPLGDIDLQHEIGVKKYTGVLNYQPERARVRRVYSARVDGRNSSVTVVMYQGTGAEEEWREDVTKYKTVRHPNLVQVWGTASMGNIHATIFHDDLIPFEDLLDLHKDSPLLTLYIWAYIGYHRVHSMAAHIRGGQALTPLQVVQNYFESTLQRDLHDTDCTFFIRRSTGQFCADLIPNDESLLWMALDSDTLLPQGLEPLDAPNIETIAINFLTLDQYHRGCYFCLAKYRSSGGSTPRLVTFGTVYYISADNDPVEIASMPEAEFDHYHYYSKVSFGDQLREGMEKGWTQVTSEVAADSKSDFVWSSKAYIQPPRDLVQF
ncbi:hypothetical protein K438DRAFT_1841063 [Mycena galopus ATCC 62051]|nr:hypothetical protein K438DRAFT_1841063 [Mycena galopus ATCC 62051]